MFVVANNLKNSLARPSLYCVWIKKDDHPNAPLVAVWIDPAMRAFEPQASEQACGVSPTGRVFVLDEDASQDEDELPAGRRSHRAEKGA